MALTPTVEVSSLKIFSLFKVSNAFVNTLPILPVWLTTLAGLIDGALIWPFANGDQPY